jgi:hypothetical protein
MNEKSESTPTPPASWQRFPRSSFLPNQSPKYWAKEKDRYLRQLLIRDIEETTGRPLIVYFSELDQEISHLDPDDLAEILGGVSGRSADLLIQTPGGSVDATEKMISVLRQRLDDYRVIVPSWAKSAGTVIALSSTNILLGINSELGPIDPQWNTPNGMVPCEIIAKDPTFPPHLQLMADMAVQRMNTLAASLLKRGMLSAQDDTYISALLSKISRSSGYNSHGAVIDYSEAKDLGLAVEYLPPEGELWQRI